MLIVPRPQIVHHIEYKYFPLATTCNHNLLTATENCNIRLQVFNYYYSNLSGVSASIYLLLQQALPFSYHIYLFMAHFTNVISGNY